MSRFLIAVILLLASPAFAADQVEIQVKFSEKVNVNGQDITYSSALYFTPEQYSSITPDELAAMKADRVANWKNMLENPPVPVEPTPEQLKAELETIPSQIELLEVRKAELEDKLGIVEEPPVEPEPEGTQE
jgi:hypothetical protein